MQIKIDGLFDYFAQTVFSLVSKRFHLPRKVYDELGKYLIQIQNRAYYQIYLLIRG